MLLRSSTSRRSDSLARVRLQGPLHDARLQLIARLTQKRLRRVYVRRAMSWRRASWSGPWRGRRANESLRREVKKRKSIEEQLEPRPPIQSPAGPGN